MPIHIDPPTGGPCRDVPSWAILGVLVLLLGLAVLAALGAP